ncbi:curli production assembly/transport component CsgG [Prolixibacteraceae bacterium JC049]|nr:curli production assembly/transport component CsgG [Prolixibacteraceae bacterium JC049]
MMQPMKTTPAQLGPLTHINTELQSLPKPKQKIVAAVYKFRDQTGQYKPSMGATWSTAVTQGGTTVLIKALEESGWFIPIERENIGNLLNERKIIRSSRAQFNNSQQKQLLPPLLFAGVILEGGIISYESNVVTGGAGLKYFGAGGSGQYREDRVTVYLRAVSTNNGKILKTVYTTKSLLSQEIKAGLFRYVKFKRLLEAETGFTYNEPTEMAVKEAIEKAVISLIYDGIEDNLWQFNTAKDTLSYSYASYLKEKYNLATKDYWGNTQKTNNRKKINIGGEIQSLRMISDFGNSSQNLMYNMKVGGTLSPKLHINLTAGYSNVELDPKKEISLLKTDVELLYLPYHSNKITPYLGIGGGVLNNSISKSSSISAATVPFAKGIVGVEYMANPSLGITFSGSYNYALKDGLDGIVKGKYKDSFFTFGIGFNFYLFKPRKKPFNF